MNTQAPAAVGLIDLPSMATLCARSGISAVTGDDYRAAATSIRASLNDSGPFPIMVCDLEPWPGMRAWVEKAARETTVVVLRTGHPNAPLFTGAAEVVLPATAAEIFAAAGLAVSDLIADEVIEHDTTLRAAHPLAQMTSPVVEQPVAVQPVAVQPVAVQPVVEAVSAVPAPIQPVAVEDPWEAQRIAREVAAEAARAAQAPVVAPVAPVVVVEDPWEAQRRPALAEFLPAVVPVEPIPVEPIPAPVAVEPVVAPLVVEPVPAPAPVAVEPVAAPVVVAPVPAPVAVEPVVAPVAVEPVAAPVVVEPVPAPVAVAPVAAPVVVAPVPAPVAVEPVVVEPTYAPVIVEPVVAPVVPAPVVVEPTYAPVIVAPAPMAAPAMAPAPVDVRPPAPVQYPTESTGYPVDHPAAYLPPTSADYSAGYPSDYPGDHSVESPAARRSQRLGEVAVVWAGKGGVGKSTLSFSLAQRASEAGLRVILIDGNLGQGDMRTFLRIGSAGLPSIYQAAVSGGLRSCLIDPDTLNAARGSRVDPLGFALVQAPPPHLVDPDVVTPEVYLAVVQEARTMCDLVVVDTQIIDALTGHGTTGMVPRFVNPLLRAGAWGVGVSDLTAPGIENLVTRLKSFATSDIPRDRLVTALNRVPRDVPYNDSGVASLFNEHSVFLGAVFADEAIQGAMLRGQAVSDMPVIAPILDAALRRVTGLEEFTPNASAAAAAQARLTAQSGKGGLLSRFRKGRA